MAVVPERKVDAPMRVPISGAYKIKGVGDVLAGRVEQGVVKPGDEVIFLPTHTTANPCIGKVGKICVTVQQCIVAAVSLCLKWSWQSSTLRTCWACCWSPVVVSFARCSTAVI